MLVSVPRFDFNWQLVYYQDKPLMLPKGTKITLDAHWDNSANNRMNPDPQATIKLGRPELGRDDLRLGRRGGSAGC
jgi:hypothetical protein